VDLLPGQVVRLAFTMGTGEMKLLIPDPSASYVYRSSNMHPTSTTALDQWNTLGYNANDLAYDADGMIIIGYALGSPPANVWYGWTRDVNYGNGNQRQTGLTLTGVYSTVTIDPASKTVYTYGNAGSTTPNYIIRGFTPYDATTPPPTQTNILLPAAIGNSAPIVTALRLENGVFYITALTSPPRIFRFLPGGSVASATSPNMQNPVDLLIKGNTLYIANSPFNFTGNNLYPATIEVFDKNTLAFIGSYGTKTSSPYDNTPGHFYGPHHFIAPTSRKFYIIDDGTIGSGLNRVVAVDDITTMSGWDTLYKENIPAPPSPPPTPFIFWQQC
jgi:hypothetical protein